MSKPYRVIVWGPGAMGQAAIRELLRRDEFEIVGTLAYSESKNGKDVGELVGKDSIGVKATTDMEAIYAMDADCVVYCGRYCPTLESNEVQNQEIIRILESGKNVCTPVAYVYPPAQGEGLDKRFEDACKKGGSSLHGTGENPGFWMERVAVTLTGICNDVESITLREYADCSGVTVETMKATGFGMEEEEAREHFSWVRNVWEKYHFGNTLNLVSQSVFGKHLEKYEVVPEFHLAKEDIVFETSKGDPMDFEIKKGRVQGVSMRSNGYVDGQLRLSDIVNWYLTERASPFVGKADAVWDIEIEGRPTSIRSTFQAMASVKNNEEFYPDDPTTPTWYVTIAAVIQSIPVVCAHVPGIVYPTIFTSCVPDLRTLATRKTMVG